MIIANQTLHGYANGHQMIASSYDWSLDDRKKMDVLSDLNSRCNKEDLSYYTGYPLSDGEKYVIAKTWYASEMSRPGCVWTHSIIFNIEDFSKINDFDEVITAFQRPVRNDYEAYSYDIEFINDNQVLNNYDENLLEYIIYTIYGTASPRMVYFDECNSDIVREILFCIHDMPIQLLRDFSFSTMTYEARSYNNKVFSYQVTTEKLVESLKIRNPQLEICVPYKEIEKMPYWVSCFYDYLKHEKIGEIYSFINHYGEQFFEWESFNGFVRIFFLLQSEKILTLNEFFNILLQVIENHGNCLVQRTVDLLLENDFSAYSFKSVEYQILENLDMGGFKLTKNQKHNLYDKIMLGQLEDLFPLLCKYKEGKLKRKSKEFLEKIVLNLRPNDLKRVSRMDEDICVIIVHLNQKLLLSEDIWKEKRDFQITMLYSGGKWNDELSLKKLLKLIISKYKTDVADEIYTIYGDDVIPLILDILKEETIDNESYLSHWYSIIEKKPAELLSVLNDFYSRELCRNLFCRIDMRNKSVIDSVDPNIWNQLFSKIVLPEDDDLWFEKLSLNYVIVIFSTEYRFENELVKKVLDPIYDRILNNCIDMNEWNYFQYLLPEVEPCYSWDKCLRVREALNIRGYKIKDINC